MRPAIGVLCVLLGAGAAGAADESGKRYGVEPDLKSYPQATPKEALTSVLKAVENKRFAYLTAQLADPAFIDDQVQRLYGGRFLDQVDAVQTRLDPPSVKLLQRFLTEGEFSADKDQATATLKDVKDRVVRLKQVGGRWYLEHRSTPDAPAPTKGKPQP
jgi:hypothetical protein